MQNYIVHNFCSIDPFGENHWDGLIKVVTSSVESDSQITNASLRKHISKV
jgi:hypothetical protein